MTVESVSDALHFLAFFLDYAARLTPVLLALGGLLGYYYRERIKAVIAKSLAIDIESLRHQFAKELAEHSSKLERDLESYKVALLAEAERVKAAQDVRKTIAVKAAERRFSALVALMDAHFGLDTDVGSIVTWDRSEEPEMKKLFLKRKSELQSRVAEYARANDNAQVFLSRDMRVKVIGVRRAFLDVLALRDGIDGEPVSKEHPAINALLERSIDLERDLAKLLEEFERA